MEVSLHHCYPLHMSKFTDDCKCLCTISSPFDYLLLQSEFYLLQSTSSDWKLAFNPSKCKHLRFQHLLSNIVILTCLMKHITLTQLTRTLVLTSLITFHGLTTTPLLSPKLILLSIRCAISSHHPILTKLTLHTSLFRTCLTYCRQIWHPLLL